MTGDANDRLRAGTLPYDPFEASAPFRSGNGSGGNGRDSHNGAAGPHCSDSSDCSEPTWDAPIPIGASANLPKFPVSALPVALAAYVQALAVSMQVPVDLPAMLVLGVLATAAAGKFELEIRSDWVEQLCLYLVVALPPGERKSPVFRDATRPLLRYEQQCGVRLVLDDVTPERIAVFLSEHDGRGAVLSAEGGLFEILRGRYSDGMPSLDVVLKAHDGDFVRVDRITRDSIVLNKPVLTLALCVQPDVIKMLSSHPALRGRGLLGRLLYALPIPMMGWREIRPAPVPPRIRDRYYAIVERMLRFTAGREVITVQLDADADDRLARFEAGLEPRLRPGSDLNGISDWAGKLAGRVARIAALLHLVEAIGLGPGGSDVTTTAGERADTAETVVGLIKPVRPDAIERALEIADYLIAHALAAFSEMGEDARVANARYVLGVLGALRQPVVAQTEIAEAARGRIRLVEHLAPALALLVKHGWLREVPRERKGSRGRHPTPEYRLHPSLLARDQSDQSDQSARTSRRAPNGPS